jgi:thiaminase
MAAIEKVAKVKAAVEQVKASFYDNWIKTHASAGSEGMILDQKALDGAAQAMNDKYGAGSVIIP